MEAKENSSFVHCKNWGVSWQDFVIQAGLETSPEFGNSSQFSESPPTKLILAAKAIKVLPVQVVQGCAGAANYWALVWGSHSGTSAWVNTIWNNEGLEEGWVSW